MMVSILWFELLVFAGRVVDYKPVGCPWMELYHRGKPRESLKRLFRLKVWCGSNVAICSECNQLRSFHEVYFKSRYVLHHLCRWVSHHLLTTKHVFVPPHFVAKETTLFPISSMFPSKICFPYNNRVILIMGDFRVCFGNSEISHWVFSPFRAPLRPQVRRSGRQCILTLAGEQFAVCSLKTGVAWCTQE